MHEKTVLDNGIRVITEQVPGAHSVTIGCWVVNGSRHEEEHQNGISHFIEHMLFKGTENRDALEIAKEIDSVGGVLNAFTSHEFSCYYAKVLARHLPLAIDLLADVVLESVFDLDEIEKERRVILQELYMLEDTAEEQVHELFIQNFWKNHPLGLSILGTRETVSGFSRQGLLDFMRKRYCSDNILICVAGDLTHQRVAEQVATAFGPVPRCGELPAGVAPRYGRQFNVSEKELEQVHICLGTRALPQNHPDRFACHLLNTILGGSMSSRLFQSIREEKGLAYSIYSYMHNHSDAGALVIYSGTSPEEAPEVIGLMLDELKKLKDEPVGEDELHAAKEQLKGHLLLSMESTDNRMVRLAKNELYMGRHPTLKEVLRGFDQVSGEHLQQLAGSLIQDRYLNLQLVGKIGDADFSTYDLTVE